MAILNGQSEFNKLSFTTSDYFIYLGQASKQLQFVDYTPDIRKYFGVNAYQDSEKLVVNKSDLGLTQLKIYSAESIFVALLLKIMNHEDTRMTAPILIEKFKTEFITANQLNWIRDILLVNLFIPVKYTYDLGDVEFKPIADFNTPITPNDF